MAAFVFSAKGTFWCHIWSYTSYREDSLSSFLNTEVLKCYITCNQLPVHRLSTVTGKLTFLIYYHYFILASLPDQHKSLGTRVLLYMIKPLAWSTEVCKYFAAILACLGSQHNRNMSFEQKICGIPIIETAHIIQFFEKVDLTRFFHNRNKKELYRSNNSRRVA